MGIIDTFLYHLEATLPQLIILGKTIISNFCYHICNIIYMSPLVYLLTSNIWLVPSRSVEISPKE